MGFQPLRHNPDTQAISAGGATHPPTGHPGVSHPLGDPLPGRPPGHVSDRSALGVLRYRASSHYRSRDASSTPRVPSCRFLPGLSSLLRNRREPRPRLQGLHPRQEPQTQDAGFSRTPDPHALLRFRLSRALYRSTGTPPSAAPSPPVLPPRALAVRAWPALQGLRSVKRSGRVLPDPTGLS
jgi:hypothetical protein